MLNDKTSNNWPMHPSTAEATAITDIAADGSAADLYDLWQPEDKDQGKISAAVEEHLYEKGYITTGQIEQARSIHHKTPRKKIGQILLEMGVIKEADLLACLAEQYGLPFIRLEREMVDLKALQLIDKSFAQAHNILPYAIEEGKLALATTDPTNVFLLDEIQRKVSMPLAVKVSTAEDIKNILNKVGETSSDYHVNDIIQDIGDDDVEVINTKEEDIADLEAAAGDSPIIKFVNYVIYNAVKEGASDIHIEPGDKTLKLRYRVDGILFEAINPPHNMHAAVVSRIKIMANMDIAERRLPQDGRVRVLIHGRNIDMRVSTLPTTHGEKVVMRILDAGAAKLNLEALGMEPDTMAVINHQIMQPHGIILVTGPTGSGKSTTLYAAIRSMDTQSLNISTVEDPVEFQLNGISQVQVHEHIGMTFASALRSLLRQDPDIIMVGEIRDEETARIAIQASLTGHLVLSTLHTNDAPSSITRLINIGIEPYLIAASTNAVLAQRLVRRICPKCKSPYEPEAEQAGFMTMYGFSTDKIFRGAGCDDCRHTGYQGRVGIYELLALDDTYRDIITKKPTVTELRRICKERGMTSLRDQGFRKVHAGVTTIEEVMRVTECTI